MAGKRKRSTLLSAFHFVTAGLFEEAVTPHVREAAERAARVRQSIAAVSVLKSGVAIPPGDFALNLISPGLGFFDIPDIDEGFLMGPKG